MQRTPLDHIIRKEISENGPISVAAFMDLALAHPEHGYYMTRDPLGAAGDFTTAPEISQMFGEMIGVWLADVWIKMGCPARINLVECGAGRGTLMVDIWRATAHIKGFHEAVKIHIVEISPVLVAIQQKNCAGFPVIWHESPDDIPQDAPVFIIGNEFLDALPIYQIIRTREGWRERVVSLDPQEDVLIFSLQKIDSIDFFDAKFQSLAVYNQIYEYCPAQYKFMDLCINLLKICGGAALFIDYGYVDKSYGDTLQAVHKHAFSNPLENIGNSDITAYVDFGAILRQVRENALPVYGPAEQGAFLKKMGIEHRARVLGDKNGALARLIASDQMGSLFKVIAFMDGKNHSVPEGF